MRSTACWAATASAIAIAALATVGCSSSEPAASSSSSAASSSPSASSSAADTAEATEEGPAGEVAPAADVAKAIVGQLDQPRPVDCPSDLVAQDGQSVDCTLTLSEAESIQVRMTVTKVDPANPKNFDFALSSLFTPEQLQTQVLKFVSRQDPSAGDVDCPEGIEGRVGATTTCTVRAGDGTEATIRSTVSQAGPASMSIDFASE